MCTSLLNKNALLKIWQDNKPALLFIGKLILIYVSWKCWIWFIGKEDIPLDERIWPWLSGVWEGFNDLVRIALIYPCSWMLEGIGISSTPYEYEMGINGTGGMRVGNYCLALQLWWFFAGLVLVFPSPWKHKLWFIPLGIAVIHVLNIFRITALGWLLVHAPDYFAVNHYYILRGTVFLVIFLLSIPYLKYFGSRQLLK